MIILIIIAGIILRFISLNQSLWLDEATTALTAKMSLQDIFSKFLPGDFHPPLYYLLMKVWVTVFGNSEISLRIPSVIFGVLTIYLIYLIAKRLFDQKTAAIASVLTATSGLLIYYSQEARMYMMAAFLVSCLIYFFIEHKWILFSFFLVFLAMTDYVALLIIPVFIIFEFKNWKKIALSLIPAVTIFIFWISIFLKQVGGGTGVMGSAWWNILGTLTLKNLSLIPVKFILGRIGFDNKLIYVSIVAFSFLIFFIPIITLIANIVRRSLKAGPYKILFGWLLIPVVLGIIISVKIPVLYYFRFLFCLPAFYILVAYGISKLHGTKFYLLLSAVILINVLSSGYYLFNPKFQREDWRGIARAVGKNTIVYPSNSQKEALIYYGKERQIIDYQNFNGRVHELWLSRYVWNIFDPRDLARIKIEKLGYNKVQELNLNGVEFWKYTK